MVSHREKLEVRLKCEERIEFDFIPDCLPHL